MVADSSTTRLPSERNGTAVGIHERVTQRQAFVLDAKVAGFRPAQILVLWDRRCQDRNQKELRVSIETIRDDVQQILRRIAQRESTKSDELRELLTMRYEAGLVAIDKQVRAGNLRAVEVMIKLCDSLGRLHGLGMAPVQETNNILVLNPDERAHRVNELLDQARSRMAMGSVIEADDDAITDLSRSEG